MNLTFSAMKTSVLTGTAVLAMTASGCSWFHHDSAATSKPAATTPAPIVTPDLSLAAKVVSVNVVGRFVVLSFPPSQMPKIDQPLFLYRGGLKVAEVRVTGPQQDNNIVADISSGDAQVGDTVSNK
jgi:hypothetical protein